MSIHEWSEYIAEVILRKAVSHWAKKCPKVLDMRTHTFVNGKRYIIHIRRGDYKEYARMMKEKGQ